MAAVERSGSHGEGTAAAGAVTPATGVQTVGNLVAGAPFVAPRELVADAADRFFNEETLDALAVVEDGRPLGLLTRPKVLSTVFQRFGFELFGRKPVIAIADCSPLLLEDSVELETAMEQALRRPAANVYDEIVVIDRSGGYRGLVSVKQLVIQQSRALANAMMSEELSRARAMELETMDRVKSQFVANVTHELRSPVNAIIGMAELLRDACDKGYLGQAKDRLALMLSSAVHLRSIVTNILDLSKIEAGRMEVIAEPFVLAEVLDEVADTTRVLLGAKPVAVEVAIEGDLPIAHTDPVKVRQILLNLAANAAKFIESGRISIRAAAEEGQFRIAVADTGCGIRPEDLGRIYEAFTQLEDAHTKRAVGTGLGLAITQSLLALLGGSITAASTYGEGATFTTRFPARYAPPEEGDARHG
jgi:signal transduction histidine kinase